MCLPWHRDWQGTVLRVDKIGSSHLPLWAHYERAVFFSQALETAVVNDVERRVIRRYEQRPRVFKDRARQLIEATKDSIDDDYIATDGAKMSAKQKTFMVDLEELLEVTDLGEDSEEWIHWCYVEDTRTNLSLNL